MRRYPSSGFGKKNWAVSGWGFLRKNSTNGGFCLGNHSHFAFFILAIRFAFARVEMHL